MKTKHLLALCAACLALGTSLSPLHAQDNNEKSGTRFGLRAGLKKPSHSQCAIEPLKIPSGSTGMYRGF